MTDRKRIMEMLAQGHSSIMIMQTIGATKEEIEEAGKDDPCSWCGARAGVNAARGEGPHSTWCVHFREAQRGGKLPLAKFDGEKVIALTEPEG